MRKRTNRIWSIPKDDLVRATESCTSLNQILKVFELDNKAYSYRNLKKRLREDGIDFSHIQLGVGANRGKKFGPSKLAKPLNSILIEGSEYNNQHLKKRLVREGLIKYVCDKCGLGDSWQGQKLSLQIDHINGVSNDNRLNNIRLLCPNCHSQTENFSGKALKTIRKCIECGSPIAKKSLKCRQCSRPNNRKVIWPNSEELDKLLWEYPATKIAERFGVSDKAVAKWAKKYGLKKPGPGYWQKK